MSSTNEEDTAPTGTSFGKYTLLQKIALGGMAEVHLAALRGPDGFEKQLVIKRVHPHLSEQPEFGVMFSNEARIAALLSHPNIAQVYEYGIVDDTAFLAMELVVGPSLDRMTKRAAKRGTVLGPDIAAAIGVQVCEALHYAHEMHGPDGQWLGLVHRDVTPSNVMVAGDGTVKLLDFGIAKVTQGPSATRTGTLKGKLAYLAPEQLTGAVDRRADLFALGVALYEAAIGRRLFKRNSEAETITAVLQGDIPRPSDLVSGFPSELEHILERALERDPSRRYATADQMGDDLERYTRRAGVGRRDLARLIAELRAEPGGSSAVRSASASTPPSVRPDPGSGPSNSGWLLSGSSSYRDEPDPMPPIAGRSAEPTSSEGSPDAVWMIAAVTATLLAVIGVWWFILG